jgi:hypothetical protein
MIRPWLAIENSFVKFPNTAGRTSRREREEALPLVSPANDPAST